MRGMRIRSKPGDGFRPWSWVMGMGPMEFGASIGLLSVLAAVAVAGVLLEGNRPKALRVGLASAAYLGALLLGGFHWWAVRTWRRVHERIAG